MADRKLDGWKEIAAHIGRDVTTAIRWEQERGLPVHRPPGGKRGAVFAHCEEIDRWLASGRRPKPIDVGNSPTGSQPEGAPGASATAGRRQLTGWPATMPSGTFYVLGAVGVIGALVAAASLRGGSEPAASGALSPPPSLSLRGVERITFERSAIVARDAQGGDVWRHAEPSSIDLEGADSPHAGRYVLADLEKDGEAEAIISLTRRVGAEEPADELVCFSATGRVRWRQRVDDVFTFRGGSFGPAWSHGRVAAFQVDGTVRIAWALNSPPSWPALLVVLDQEGRRISTFVHSGSIYALAVTSDSTRPLILAGGVSNSNRAAGFFVLDGRSASGHSREPPGSAYECLGCPAGEPLRYLLLPRSEINAALGRPYNVLENVGVSSRGFDIRTLEADVAAGGPVYQHFELSRSFELQQGYLDDNSWSVHELLERQGKLSHGVSECAMYRGAPAVRSWAPAVGWRTLEARVRHPITVGPRAPGAP